MTTFFIHLSWQHFLSSTWRNTSFFRADAVSNNNLDTVAFLRLKKMNKVWICFRQQFHGRKLVAVVSLVAELNKRYARKHNTDTDCMFMSYHLGVSEWIHTLWFPECQGTPCSKQTRKSLNECNWTRTQNHLSSQTNTQPFGQSGQTGWVFVYELSGSGFESSCSHL